MKKYFVLLACILVNGSAWPMELPYKEDDSAVPEAQRLPNDRPQIPNANINFIFSGSGERRESAYVPPLNVEWCLKHGFYEGVMQGTANIVAALMIQSVTLGIHKGVEWWQQPTEEELNKLKTYMERQAQMKVLESNLAKEQQVIITYGNVIAKLGQNVETAQKIYAAQSHSAGEQSPEEKYLEMYNLLSDMTLQSLQQNVVIANNNFLMLMNMLPAKDEQESR